MAKGQPILMQKLGFIYLNSEEEKMSKKVGMFKVGNLEKENCGKIDATNRINVIEYCMHVQEIAPNMNFLNSAGTYSAEWEARNPSCFKLATFICSLKQEETAEHWNYPNNFVCNRNSD